MQVLCEVLERLLALDFGAGLAAVQSQLNELAACCRAEVVPYAGAVATMPELVKWLSAHAPAVFTNVLRLGPQAGTGGASKDAAGLGSQGLGSQGPTGGKGARPSGDAASQLQSQTPPPEAPLAEYPKPYAARPSLQDPASSISIAALKQFLIEAGHWGLAEEARFRGSMKEDVLEFALAGADGEPSVSQHAKAATPHTLQPLGVPGTTAHGSGKDRVPVAAKESDWEVRRLLACAKLPVPGAFYAALRLPADGAPPASAVSAAHRQLMLLVHPDTIQDPGRRIEAQEAFMILNAARSALLSKSC